MTKIYEQHEAAFNGTSAYVVLDKAGERVATVAFKRRQSVTCYLHIIGLEMVRGTAHGGGYDMASAAFYQAACKVKAGHNDVGRAEELEQERAAFLAAAVVGNGGSHWDRALRDGGYTVLQAV